MNIRLLKANEIECRVQSVKKTSKGVGCIMLLYKDARCDMKILDETFGIDNWQRSHEVVNGNLFCNVGVRFMRENGFAEWVWKQDVGTESNTEKEKGQASDSFKRACFNWGIGRELYTAPFIWINLNEGEYSEYNGKVQCNAKFEVKNIAYNEEREITRLEVIDSKGNTRYTLGSKTPQNKPQAKEKVKKSNTSKEDKTPSNGGLKCEKCGTGITEKIAMWSTSNYNGKKLCMNCQKEEAKNKGVK